MQHEYKEKHNVFEDNGEVLCAGWAKNDYFLFNKDDSKQSKHICEGLCYFINNGEISLYLSIENSGIDFYIKIAVADLKKGGVISDFTVKKQLISKIEIPQSDNTGEFLFTDKKIQLQITNTPNNKFLKCNFIDFAGTKNLSFSINLKKIASEKLNQLAPFELDRRYFYFKRFAPEYIASGNIKIGNTEYQLGDEYSIGYLDHTRYSKPRKHNYQRLSADGFIGDNRFSLCLASRVGDNRYGSENCFFLNNKLEKLFKIEVRNTEGRIDRPWYFKGGISAFDVIFKPYMLANNVMTADMEKTSVVFGKLYGEIKRVDYDKPLVLDDLQAHMVFNEF